MTIRIKTPSSVLLAATMSYADKQLKDSYTFVQKQDSLLQISIAFPRKEIFTVDIYAKWKSDSGLYKFVAKYHIDARRAKTLGEFFPETYSAFHQHNCYLFEPLKGTLGAMDKIPIKIRVPGAQKVAVVINDEWIFFEKAEKYIFNKLIKNIQGEFTVYAQFPGDKVFQALVKYKK